MTSQDQAGTSKGGTGISHKKYSDKQGQPIWKQEQAEKLQGTPWTKQGQAETAKNTNQERKKKLSIQETTLSPIAL